MTLTYEQINEIIDLAKPHAKTVCDRIYDKAVKTIGGNETFKSIIDERFDHLAEIEFNILQSQFDVYFGFSNSDSIAIIDIYEVIINAGEDDEQVIIQLSRYSNKYFITAILDAVKRSVQQAFVEKLAEYIEVDISNIIA